MKSHEITSFMGKIHPKLSTDARNVAFLGCAKVE